MDARSINVAGNLRSGAGTGLKYQIPGPILMTWKAKHAVDYNVGYPNRAFMIAFLVECVMQADRYSVSFNIASIQVAHVLDTEYREFHADTIR
jgi:hypothetical protein